MSEVFRFKKFEVAQTGAAMKIGTDSVLLGAWASVLDVQRVLDIGAGTGVLSLMIAQRLAGMPETTAGFQVDAVEIDATSAALAAQNFDRSPWKNQLRAFGVRIQDFANTTDEKYDLVVSNPPFFSGGTFAEGEGRAAARHNFQLPNGDLLRAARQVLTEKGRFCVVLPWLEGIRFAEMAAVYGLYCTRRADVFGKKGRPEERILLQFEKNPYSFDREELAIYDENGHYSTGFRDMTGDFYLNFKPIPFGATGGR